MQIRLSSKVIATFLTYLYFAFFVEDFKNTNILFKRFLFRYLNLKTHSASEDDVIYMCIEIDNP